MLIVYVTNMILLRYIEAYFSIWIRELGFIYYCLAAM